MDTGSSVVAERIDELALKIGIWPEEPLRFLTSISI